MSKTYVVDNVNMTITADCGSNQASQTRFESNITVRKMDNNGTMIKLDRFNFGRVNQEVGQSETGYFVDLLPSNTTLYGTNANKAVLTLDTEGILLPEDRYRKFRNMLAVATEGSSDCGEISE